ncbi:MAG: Asp-tRNA(Asn)/Glu-tRNA(Gln) amidotransferase subunit GatC [Candidatus Pacebacteria bacterium]|nr:Asp-tRNA(Asn)/Glu-tRNA(Gln) amidotransferase subunit GatC [Candidatus Paceibacterota bacterium]
MNKEDILDLAKLARLELSDDEVQKYSKEIGDILGYVEQINSAIVEAGEGSDVIENIGARNIFRADENPDAPETYKADLLKCAPHVKDDFIKVQKILNTENGSN